MRTDYKAFHLRYEVKCGDIRAPRSYYRFVSADDQLESSKFNSVLTRAMPRRPDKPNPVGSIIHRPLGGAEHRVSVHDFPLDQWNKIEIVVTSRRTRILVNERQVLDEMDQGEAPAQGAIGLKWLSTLLAHYRNIAIKELP